MNFGQALLCLTVDLKHLYIFDPIDGELILLHSFPERITAMTVLEHNYTNQIVFGTFSGSIKVYNLLNTTTKEETENVVVFEEVVSETRQLGTQPILFLKSESESNDDKSSRLIAVDSSGCLYIDNKQVLNDGILQPSALETSEHFIFLAKWKNLYQISKADGSIKIFSIEKLDVGGTIIKAVCQLKLKSCFVSDSGSADSGRLLIVTESGKMFTFSMKDETISRFSNETQEAETQQEEDDDDEDVEDAEDKIEEEEESESMEKDSVLALVNNSNLDLAVLLKVNHFTKKCNVELFGSPTNISTNNTNTTQNTTSLNLPKINVKCPLCPPTSRSKELQELSLSATSCNNGHPISICAKTLSRINSVKFFRCRQCKLTYSERPARCIHCDGFIQ